MIKHNIIIVGCGAITFRWLDHITRRDDCRILALVDRNVDNALNYRDRYNLDCNIYTSEKEALEREKGDLLIDLTFVTAHCEIVTTALKAGCDVFGEKPMAFTVDQVNEILKTVDETGKHYFVMQNRRFIDRVAKIRELVKSGLLGEPTLLSGSIYVNADMGSIRNALKYPQLQDNNIHSFDMARYLVDGRPTSVIYHSFRPKGSMYTGDSACDAVFEFDNGVTYLFRGYNGAQACWTSWDNEWRIDCDKGSVVWDGAGDVRYQYFDRTNGLHFGEWYKEGVFEKPETVRDQHDGALEDLFDALNTGRTPGTDCKDNVYSIAMVLASIKSIEENRKVEIVVNDSYPYLVLK